MVEPDTRPELVLRRHLETRDGPVEAHILHLQQTFQVEDLSPDNLVRISEALGNAQILVDPPLEEVSEDGRLMLSIAPGTASPPSARNGGRTRPERSGIRRRFRRGQPKTKRGERELAPAQNSEEALADTSAWALDVLEEKGPEETLASISDLVSALEADANRSLIESSDFLNRAQALGEQLDQRLSTLDEDLRSFANRDGSIGKQLAESGERAKQLARESKERVAAACDALERELSDEGWRAEVQAHFGELAAAAHELPEIQQQGPEEVAQRETELAEARRRIGRARDSVEEALSNSAVSEQLEVRVAALREAEAAEGAAQRSVEQARERFETELQRAAARLNAAQSQLAGAIASRADPTQPLRTRLDELGEAQGAALEPGEPELPALSAGDLTSLMSQLRIEAARKPSQD